MKIKEADLGVLLNESQLRSALQGRYFFEYLPFYTEVAKNEGLHLIFLTDSSVWKDDAVKAVSWNTRTKNYEQGTYRLPKVMHNRALLSASRMPNILPLLKQDCLLYNQTTRYDKWKVHRKLLSNPLTKTYLPYTEPMRSEKQVERLLGRYGSVFLKPRSGSLGQGVIRIKKIDGKNEVSYTANGQCIQYRISGDKIAGIIRKIGARPYLVQEGIQLIKLAGKPVDFRISVQKGLRGEWGVSGIVAKLGAFGTHATNLAVGGKAVPALEVLRAIFSKKAAEILYGELSAASLAIARQMEGITENLADLGLDMTVTRDGQIRFIEANGRDLRITFRNANQLETWEQTYQNPVLYGIHLLERRGLIPGRADAITAEHHEGAEDLTVEEALDELEAEKALEEDQVLKEDAVMEDEA